MMPLQFVDAIAEALESLMGAGYTVQTEPLDVLSLDKYIAVFPMSWEPDGESVEIGSSQNNKQGEPTINYYHLRVQNLTIHGDIQVAYTQFTNDQRKIRAILYRDTTLGVALRSMQENYLGSRESFKRMTVSRQNTLPGRQRGAMYFMCETDIIITTDTVRTAP